MYTFSVKAFKGEGDIACCISAVLLMYFSQNVRNAKKLGDINKYTCLN